MKSTCVPIAFPRIWVFAVVSAAVLLSACGGPTRKGGLPTCSGAALQTPETLRPGGAPDEEGILIDTLSPTFTWAYPDSTCDPEHIVLRIATSWHELETDPLEIRLDGAERSWIPADPLEPGTTYLWRAAAESGGEESGTGIGIFRTGPECVVISPGTMSAPNLLWPPDRSVVRSLNFTMDWDDPTACIPPGWYKVEIDTAPAFPDPLVGTYPEPYLYVAHPWVDFDLEDCTHYYWRVKIDLRDRIDSEDGPWSATWSFFTNASGSCPLDPGFSAVTPIPGIDIPVTSGSSGWITGVVWHDLCALPYASTDVAPPGCVWVSDIEGYWANGIFEAGEPGLAGVTVDLGAGACPSTGLATTLTRSDGRYSFGPLAPGTYCVSVNALSEANIPVLIPGEWTFPSRDTEVAEHTVTLGAGDLSENNNFGWDFQFLPSPSSGAPTAKLLQDAYCRKGPGIDYESLTTLLRGLEVPIDGRNAENSWWWVRIPNSLNHCWLGAENVQTSGDLSQVPVVEAEPSACWVKPPQGPDKCVSPCPQGADPGGACTP
jgi:hypothetical protein